MARKAYEHSAYWHAKNSGQTRSDRATHVERLLDEVRRDLAFGGGRVNGSLSCDPLGFGACLAVCAAMDIGEAMRETARKVADPAARDRMRRELLRDLRAVRRPFYYARETARRRALAAARRKLSRRTTLAPEPTPADVRAAWERRKGSMADMIRLGGMLHDLACYVDSSLRFDANGDVAGRNGGIRGWLRENLPELFPKCKTLMRYKAMAVRLRQATETRDPTPTSALLGDAPGGAEAAREAGRDGKPHKVVRELLEEFRMTFSSLEEGLSRRLDPEQVFLDPAKGKRRHLGPARGKRGSSDSAKGKRRVPDSAMPDPEKGKREAIRRKGDGNLARRGETGVLRTGKNKDSENRELTDGFTRD